MFRFNPQNLYCHKFSPIGDNNLYLIEKSANLPVDYVFVRKAVIFFGLGYILQEQKVGLAKNFLRLEVMQNLGSFQKMDIEIESLQEELNKISPIFGESCPIVSERRKELAWLQKVRRAG